MGREYLKGTIHVDIQADIDSVYELVSNHTELSKISDMIVKVRMRSERPESAVNEETISLRGKLYKCMIKHIFEAPSTHTYTVIGGDAKGSRVIERLYEIQNGTRINMSLLWKIGLFGFGSRGIIDDHMTLLNNVKMHLER